MKKVLIYKSISDLKPIGGPNGYLYNLNYGLSKYRDTYLEISFLPENQQKNKNKFFSWFVKSIKKLWGLRGIAHYLYAYYFILSNKGFSSGVDFSNYDIIHFHSTYDYYSCRESLKYYKGKIILTSHCPKAFHQEFLGDDLQIKADKYLKKRFEYIDIFAFNNANYILFPCREAEECYYNQWDKYKKIHEKNKDKYIYLETGLIPIFISESKEDLRKKYKLQKDDYVLCYVGRHNEVKGYDNLKKLGNNYLKEKQNAKFLIAGKEEPLKGLNNDRWVEIGRTNKPYEIIKSSDVFILPNKETYFDLILLEVLSLGKTIVLTRTGGNKYFEKFKDSGLFFYDYDNQQEFNTILDKLSHENLDEIGRKNKKIFDENFTSEIFAKKYIEFYKSLF